MWRSNVFSVIDDLSGVMDTLAGEAIEGRRQLYPFKTKETPDHWEAETDLPGVSKSTLEVKIENGILEASGSRGEKKILRSARIPRSLDIQNASAELADGVLRVKIPRLPDHKARVIKVEIR